MRCNYCGNEQPEGKFCDNCGLAFPDFKPPAGSTQGARERDRDSEEPLCPQCFVRATRGICPSCGVILTRET